MMGGSMEPLKESESFISIMTEFSNPALGILAGAVFTAVIQSSSASVGILQTLANEELIAFDSAVFVLFGQNIGTCITAVLASIGTNRSAKRTTIIHLLFNIIGTAIFTTLCLLLPVTDWIKSISPDLPASQIANMHTVFNVATTLILIPFGNYLAKFAEKILPDTESKNQASTISVLSDEFRRGRISLGSSAVHIDVLKQEIDRMITLVGQNTEMCYHTVIESDKTMLQEVEKNEEVIDTMNKEISQYISRILVNNKIGHSVEDIEEYFLITGNAERIGDHAVNIAGYIEVINRKSIVFSEEARSELAEMQSISKQTIEKLLNRSEAPEKWLSRVAALEQKIDDMTSAYREKHLERMRQGKCTEEACVLYSELLTDFERIGDHALNIAQCFSKIHAKV